MMSKILKLFYFTLIFTTSFHFKAIAEPTFVQSKLIDDQFYLGLNFKITPNSKLYNSASIKGKRDI